MKKLKRLWNFVGAAQTGISIMAAFGITLPLGAVGLILNRLGVMGWNPLVVILVTAFIWAPIPMLWITHRYRRQRREDLIKIATIMLKQKQAIDSVGATHQKDVSKLLDLLTTQNETIESSLGIRERGADKALWEEILAGLDPPSPPRGNLPDK